jgi:hypothetical protein
VNKTFENWFRQQLDSNNKDDKSHLIPSCNTETCNCKLTEDLIIKAFQFTAFNINYLRSLNRIYNFKEKIEPIRSKIEEILKSRKHREKAMLITELGLCHEEFKIDLKQVKVMRFGSCILSDQ